MTNPKSNYFQRRNKPTGPRANERIRALDVQVIGSGGNNLGTLPLKNRMITKYFLYMKISLVFRLFQICYHIFTQ